MRKRFYDERVCSCSPTKGVTYMESRTLEAIVNCSIHALRCAANCGWKALRALTLGDLCAEAHHPGWARRIWLLAIDLIHRKDYDDWCDVWFNTKYVRLSDVISDGICEVLGRRVDDLERRMGWAEPKGRDCWEYWAGDGWYDSFCYEKYDCECSWEHYRQQFLELRSTSLAEQTTARLFQEALGDLPPQAQDFFDYWEDYDRLAQDLYFKIDDWD